MRARFSVTLLTSAASKKYQPAQMSAWPFPGLRRRRKSIRAGGRLSRSPGKVPHHILRRTIHGTESVVTGGFAIFVFARGRNARERTGQSGGLRRIFVFPSAEFSGGQQFERIHSLGRVQVCTVVRRSRRSRRGLRRRIIGDDVFGWSAGIVSGAHLAVCAFLDRRSALRPDGL